MKHPAALVLALALPTAASAADFTSEYTKVGSQEDGVCTIIAQAAEDEGDWADIVCRGHSNYPFVISYGDARETITYGFAQHRVMPSFAPFNYAHDTIEWRLLTENGAKRPVAAIHRWFVSNGERESTTQILVVSKVGQPDGSGEACVIGYVAAADGAPANVRARAMADRALDWECGSEIIVEPAVRAFAPTP